MSESAVHFSLAWNFDRDLTKSVIRLNQQYGQKRRIIEVYGALADSPISSARPTIRLPRTSWDDFAAQVEELQAGGVAFNFLMNTRIRSFSSIESSLSSYLDRLLGIGITKLTLGTPELVSWVTQRYPQFHTTLSITYGTRTLAHIKSAKMAGASAVYLDAVRVNRNFALLRHLIGSSRLECRLYANVSCISHCPVVHEHYEMFAGAQDENTALLNNAFFAGCSLVKATNPLEWIQAPWIRPEDIRAYVCEGIRHFKLSDRLADSTTLLRIAKSYLTQKSPPNLFSIIERDGTKYRCINDGKFAGGAIVESGRIPESFIDHFREGKCVSRNSSCKMCLTAARAVNLGSLGDGPTLTSEVAAKVPIALLRRAKLSLPRIRMRDTKT